MGSFFSAKEEYLIAVDFGFPDRRHFTCPRLLPQWQGHDKGRSLGGVLSTAILAICRSTIVWAIARPIPARRQHKCSDLSVGKRVGKAGRHTADQINCRYLAPKSGQSGARFELSWPRLHLAQDAQLILQQHLRVYPVFAQSASDLLGGARVSRINHDTSQGGGAEVTRPGSRNYALCFPNTPKGDGE